VFYQVKLPDWNAKSVIAVMLASTVCFIMVTSTVAAFFRPPDQISDVFRQKMFEVILVIVGALVGHLARNGTKSPPTGEPPK
jgi:hypothetical protein